MGKGSVVVTEPALVEAAEEQGGGGKNGADNEDLRPRFDRAEDIPKTHPKKRFVRPDGVKDSRTPHVCVLPIG